MIWIIFSAALFLVLIFKGKSIVSFIKSANAPDKYNVIIFLAVTIASLVLIVVCNIGTQDEATIRNLILLTITSVTIALLMDRIGVLNEINQKLKESDKFRTRTEIENDYPLYKMWENATKVKVVTMGGTIFFLGKLKENLDSTIANGADFTLVTIMPESEAWNEHCANKMKNDVEANKSACLDVPKTVIEGYKDKIHYYQTEVNLPYALMSVEKKNPKESFVKVDLYSIDIEDGKRPCMILYPGDTHYEFFKEQIETIIGKSKKATELEGNNSSKT